MKKIFLVIFSITLIFILITKSTVLVSGVRSGMLLCFYQVIPALLPMIFLTNFMQKENISYTISKIIYPILHGIFGVSPYGAFGLLTGFLCGFPVASKTINDLYISEKISKKEASYLMTFCNNCSISFGINYLGIYCLSGSIPTSKILLFLYAPPLITGIINQFFYHFSTFTTNNTCIEINIIKDTFNAMVKICFYVIGFTVLANIIFLLPLPYLKNITALLEITTGLSFLTRDGLTTSIIINVFICTVFGGLSSMFQCFSFLQTTPLKYYYIVGKMEQIAVLLILIYFFF